MSFVYVTPVDLDPSTFTFPRPKPTEALNHLATSVTVADTVSSTKDRTYRFGEDIGEIVDSVTLAVDGEGYDYRIIRRDSQQIQVFNKEEKVTAKPVLKKIIKTRNLDILFTGINTRTMGPKVME
jgi:hypothetical protein